MSAFSGKSRNIDSVIQKASRRNRLFSAIRASDDQAD